MKDIIKKELDRRFHDNMKAAEQFEEGSYPYIMFVSAAKEDYDLLAFIENAEEEQKGVESPMAVLDNVVNQEIWGCENPNVMDDSMMCDGNCALCGWYRKHTIPILTIDK